MAEMGETSEGGTWLDSAHALESFVVQYTLLLQELFDLLEASLCVLLSVLFANRRSE